MKNYRIILFFLLSFPMILVAQPKQEYVDYYDNEETKKRSEGVYVYGYEDGLWQYWYPSGKIKERQSLRRRRKPLKGKH